MNGSWYFWKNFDFLATEILEFSKKSGLSHLNVIS